MRKTQARTPMTLADLQRHLRNRKARLKTTIAMLSRRKLTALEKRRLNALRRILRKMP